MSGPKTPPGAPTLVEIEDPAAAYIYIMDNITKVVHRIKATVVQQRNAEQSITRVLARAAPDGPQPQSSTEDLGIQTIQGVQVHGTRLSTVFPRNSRQQRAAHHDTGYLVLAGSESDSQHGDQRRSRGNLGEQRREFKPQ